MITYVAGSLFDSPAQVLVNTVNTVGVMGKGIALEFKKRYPEMFGEYQRRCERGELTIGKLYLYTIPDRWILNFPTKKHWRDPSKVSYIEAGLEEFARRYIRWGIHSISFPALGCGNGGLDFVSQVQPVMHRYLASLPIDVYVHPEAARATLPEHQTPDAVQTWLRAHPRDLAFAEVWNDLKSLFAEPTPAERPDAREAFRVHIPSGAESVQITLPDGAVLSIAAEILLPFWQRLRDGGFVQLGSMPDLEQDGVAYLMGVFAALPYVRRVDISPEYDTLGANAPRGLQIISVDAAPEATQQLALFEVG